MCERVNEVSLRGETPPVGCSLLPHEAATPTQRRSKEDDRWPYCETRARARNLDLALSPHTGSCIFTQQWTDACCFAPSGVWLSASHDQRVRRLFFSCFFQIYIYFFFNYFIVTFYVQSRSVLYWVSHLLVCCGTAIFIQLIIVNHIKPTLN